MTYDLKIPVKGLALSAIDCSGLALRVSTTMDVRLERALRRRMGVVRRRQNAWIRSTFGVCFPMPPSCLVGRFHCHLPTKNWVTSYPHSPHSRCTVGLAGARISIWS